MSESQRTFALILLSLVVGAVLWFGESVSAEMSSPPTLITNETDDLICTIPTMNTSRAHVPTTQVRGFHACENNVAGGFACENVDLLSQLPLSLMGATDTSVTGNDHWYWRDSAEQRDYVLFGMSDGVSFIDVTEPSSPVYKGKLSSHTGSSPYRDIKVYANHAYIVADQIDDHGMQVFDLTQLRTVITPQTFTTTAHFDGFGNGHNLWINEATGFGYVLRTDTCNGTYMLDLTSPANPQSAGCFLDDGVASDAQCLLYEGPDADYTGQEICFTASDDAWTISDVGEKSSPDQIARVTYTNVQRAHQGAISADHRYFILSDTMDELNDGVPTTIYVWDVADLDAPSYLGPFSYNTNATDHNIYVNGQHSFQANNAAGLRVLDISTLPNLSFSEVAYFDTLPNSDSPGRAGVWSTVPWWDNGMVTLSTVEDGLIIVRVNSSPPSAVSIASMSSSQATATMRLLFEVLLLLSAATWKIVRANRPNLPTHQR